MPDWQEILARDGPAAWQTAYRLVGNRADTDDCFQQACLDAVEVSRREAVRNWRGLLQRLATLRAMDHLRARHRARRQHTLAPEDHLADPSPAPLENVEEAELANELRSALSRIPTGQAEVFCLHCIEDWSYEEIARHARISVTAVGVYLHRARKRLRNLLARFGDEASLPLRTIDPGGNQHERVQKRKEHS